MALGGPFDSVLDVGGCLGEFAYACKTQWPKARVTSFEPIGDSFAYNRERALGRWDVRNVALGAQHDRVEMWHNRTQPSASTLMEYGPVRAGLGISDYVTPETVNVVPLDDYVDLINGDCLLKIDVEGYELEVLKGATEILGFNLDGNSITTVVIEAQNNPHIFVGSPTFAELDNAIYRETGKSFVGVAGAFMHDGRVLQYDAVWR